MSQENVETLRRAFEAFNRGDLEGAVADLAPDVEYVASGATPGFGGVYQGPEAYRQFLEELVGAFDNLRIKIHEFIDAGDQVCRGNNARPWETERRGDQSDLLAGLDVSEIERCRLQRARVPLATVLSARNRSRELAGTRPARALPDSLPTGPDQLPKTAWLSHLRPIQTSDVPRWLSLPGMKLPP
jgi:ketosteroid isomerase-like protein